MTAQVNAWREQLQGNAASLLDARDELARQRAEELEALRAAVAALQAAHDAATLGVRAQAAQTTVALQQVIDANEHELARLEARDVF